MAKGRIEFPTTVVTAAGTQLEPRFAQRCAGGSKGGIVVVNLFAISGFTTPTVRIYSATDLAFDPNMATSSSYWFSCGVSGTLSGAGSFPFALTTSLSEWIRWSFDAGGSGSARFNVVINPFDA